MGGTEVLRELKRIDPDVRAIVASGYTHDGVMARFEEHGFRAMITKPFSLQEIHEVMNRVAAEPAKSGRGEASDVR